MEVNKKRFNHTPASGAYGDRLWVEDPNVDLTEKLNALSKWGGYDKSGPSGDKTPWKPVRWLSWEFGPSQCTEAVEILGLYQYHLTTDIGWLND